MKLILFAHQGAGDLLMMVPMLKSLSSVLGEDARLHIVVKGSFEASIARRIKWRCQTRYIIVGDGGWRRAFRMACYVCTQIFSRTDYLIAPLLYNRFLNILCVLVLRPRLSVARPGGALGRVVTNPTAWRTDLPEHQVDFYNRCLEATGLVKRVSEDVTLHISAEASYHATKILAALRGAEILVALCPGATPRDIKKCWPIARFAELSRTMSQSHPRVRFVLIGGAGDSDLCSQIQSLSGISESYFIQVLGAPFETVLAVMRMCGCVVAGTTGLGHMAAAADARVVVPCVPTNPSESGPKGKYVWVVTAELECAPCYRDGFAMCKEFECMTLISVTAVHNAVIDAVSGNLSPPIPKKLTTRAVGYKKFAHD